MEVNYFSFDYSNAHSKQIHPNVFQANLGLFDFIGFTNNFLLLETALPLELALTLSLLL